MVASLTANPNPVPFTWKPIVTKSSLPSTMTWTTDSTAPGRVYEVASGRETLVPGVPAAGLPKGSVTIDLRLDQSRVFVLRRADAAAVELARTTVTTRRPSLRAWLDDPDRQDIYDIKVDAGIEEIRLRFRLRRPTAPFVNLIDASTGAPVQFFASIDFVYDHDITLRGSFAPLLPDHDYTVNIVADRSKPPRDVLNDTAAASVHTGSRDVVVYFDRVRVRDDSDSHGSGEIQFEFGAGEVDTQAEWYSPGDPINFWKGDPSSGDEFHVDAHVTMPNCRRWVWAQVFGLDDDSDWGNALLTAGNIRYRDRGTYGRSEDQYDFSVVTEVFDTDRNPQRFEQQGSALVPVASERPFVLWGGDFALAFHVFGRLSVVRRPGRAKVQGLRLGRVVARPRPTTASAGLDLGLKELIVRVVKDPHGSTLVSARPALDLPDVLHVLPGAEGETATTAALAGDGTLHLFALDGRGCLLTAAGDPLLREADFGWTAVGGSFRGDLVACAAGDSALVLAVAADSSVSSWDTRGNALDGLGGDARSLFALGSPTHGIGLFAVSCGGELLHKRRDPSGRWHPAGREWEGFGPAPEGALQAQWDGADDVVLNVVEPDGDVHLCLWPGYPHHQPGPWRRIGTFSDLLRGVLQI